MAKRPEMPKLVKIGYKDYEIVEMTDLESDQHRAAGQTMHLLGKIKINLGPGTREAAETLHHEIMHAVWCIWHIPVDVKEEIAVTSLSLGLSTVWRDNPDVFAWIGYHLRHGT